MKFKQLDPHLYLVTPLGPAVCHLVWGHPDEIWYGCFQEETGECFWFPNHLIRLTPNASDGRVKVSEIKCNEAWEEFLTPHRKRYKK